MMINVDELTRRFERLIVTHCLIGKSFHIRDKVARTLAFNTINFISCANYKLSPVNQVDSETPILLSPVIGVFPSLFSSIESLGASR